MELKTIKYEVGQAKGIGPFKKSDYAILYQDLLHGTQRAVSALTRRFLVPSEGSAPKLMVKENQVNITGAESFDVDLKAVEWESVNDAIIVGQVKEWSFGPVTQETLDGLPEIIRNQLVEITNELYKQRPLPGGGVGN